jgi:hypothetical protein
MEYTIIESNDIKELSEKVNYHFVQGWEIVGSHKVRTRHWGNHESFVYSQTMIRKEEKKEIL